MPIGIDPKIDFAFKMVFGNPNHPRVTIHFLNAVLSPEHPIDWVEILNPIQDKDRAEDKLVVLDILARDRSGRQFNIEMQTTLPVDLPKRMIYYNCLIHVRQLGSGDSFSDLRPTIGICVLNRVLFAEAPEFHLRFRYCADGCDLVFSDDLQFHLLELPKFRPMSDNVANLSPLERWLYFLQHAAEMEPEVLSRQLVEAEYHEATEILEMISRSPEDRELYEARMKMLHDQEAKLDAATQKARQEGLQEGEARGEARGIEKGLVAGKIQVVQQLLGEPENTTEELTALSTDRLDELLSALQQRLRSRNR